MGSWEAHFDHYTAYRRPELAFKNNLSGLPLLFDLHRRLQRRHTGKA